MDDTQLHFLPALCEFYHKNYGIAFKPNDFHTYAFEKIWQLEITEAIRRVDAFVASEDFREIQPVEGAQEVIAALRKEHELSVVTARLSKNILLTDYQMRKNFGDVYQDRLHHGDAFHADITLRKNKSQMCLENQISILVDDGVNHAIDCAPVGIKVFLIDTPWNKNAELPSNTTRVMNWYHLYDEFQKLQLR